MFEHLPIWLSATGIAIVGVVAYIFLGWLALLIGMVLLPSIFRQKPRRERVCFYCWPVVLATGAAMALFALLVLVLLGLSMVFDLVNIMLDPRYRHPALRHKFVAT